MSAASAAPTRDRGTTEVAPRMFEPEARSFTSPVVPDVNGYEDDEPPSRSSTRLSLWNDVPDHQWDDWRWQTQNSIRSVRQLRTLLPFAPDELEALGRL